jgi:hypothetical protein
MPALPLVPACSNRTYAFAALLQLLRDPPPEVLARASASTPTGSPPDQAGGVLAKFYDLVVKCLIKLTKGLQSNTDVSFAGCWAGWMRGGGWMGMGTWVGGPVGGRRRFGWAQRCAAGLARPAPP